MIIHPPEAAHDLSASLAQYDFELSLFAGRYALSHRMESRITDFPFSGEQSIDIAGGRLCARAAVRPGSASGAHFVTLSCLAEEGTTEPVSAGIRIDLKQWSRENYLLIPGAAYAGNRFLVAPSQDSERCSEIGPDMPVTITNVPRLEAGIGPSRIQLLTSDCTSPAIGFRDASTGRGFFLLTNQGTDFGNHSLGIEENDHAAIYLKSPGIRESVRYNGAVSFDRGAVLKRGNLITIDFSLHFFQAPTILALFEYFFRIRNEFRGESRRHHEIPFSSCWEIQQTKYNAQNWVEEYGYYSVGMRESPHQDWQTGWVGGTNVIYPLLGEGTEESRNRALRVPDFVWNGGVGDSGFYRGLFHKGHWMDRHLTLTRYHADSVYFLVRSYLLHQKLNLGSIPHHWLALIRGCADAFCRTWDRYSQFGQRVNTDNGEIRMGGTACAGLAPGALALCSAFFNEPRYLQVAEASAEHYHRQFIQSGITNGGPGDILQCPDSESAFSLLEAFVVLYEVTGHRHYVDWARDAAHQCASWVVSYDFRFPPESTFGRLDMLTTGTVFANVQNKHSAPGICTLSGNSLLKLFRMTGELGYLNLVREIAHAIPQYLSRADRPICDRRPNQRWPVMAPGWINERVNLSDWEVRSDPDNEIGVGEIFGGSTWAEVAMMLTYADLPGIYLQPDTGLLSVFDHVEAELGRKEGGDVLTITNPTKFHASVKVFAEPSYETAIPLGALAMHGCPRAEVAPGATVEWKI